MIVYTCVWLCMLVSACACACMVVYDDVWLCDHCCLCMFAFGCVCLRKCLYVSV